MLKDGKFKLFVYGSLRTGMFNYERLIKGEVESSVEGSISGDLFHIENKGYPADKAGSGQIHGEVMTFKDFESSLRKMDELEHFYPERPQDCEYIRSLVEVKLANGQKTQAYFYHYNPDSPLNQNDHLIPVTSGDWRSFITKKSEKTA